MIFCKKYVIKLDWTVITLNDEGTVSNSYYFVIAVLFDEFILMWLWSPSWPQEGNHMLSLCDQFSGMCSNKKLSTSYPSEKKNKYPPKYSILF